MQKLNPAAPRLRFGAFEVDFHSGELRKAGVRVRLQEQPLQILRILLEQPGREVNREELQKRIWPSDTFVDFDHGLYSSVNKLREALGDSSDNPRFIETLPRRGYRFIAPVDKLSSVNAFVRTTSSDNERDEGDNHALGPSLVRWAERRSRFLAVATITVLLTIAGALWRQRSRLSSPPEFAQRQLTANSAESPVRSGSLSPNGRYLAYVDETGIRLKHLDTAEIAIVPEPEDMGSTSVRWRIAAWFPDSSRLLAVATQPSLRTSTWMVSLIGGPPRLVRDNAAAWSVSPDGGWIAFTANTGRFGDHGSLGDRELWVMRSNGDDARRIGDADENSVFSRARWSSDGRDLTYIRWQLQGQGSQRSIERRSISGGPPRTLLTDAGLLDYIWLPNGRLMYVVPESKNSLSPSCNLWETATTATGEPRGAPIRVTNWAGFGMDELSTTTNGSTLAFRRLAFQSSAYIADLDRDGKRITNPHRLTFNDGFNVPTAWSADSKAVLFWSRQSDQAPGIFRQLLDKKAAQPLVMSADEEVQVPRLGPDSYSVLYLQLPHDFGPSSSVSIMHVPINGGPMRLVLRTRVIDTHRCASPAVELCAFAERSTDGHRITFTALDLSKGRGRELASLEVSDPNSSYKWDISPDGTRIAAVDIVNAHVTVLPIGGTGRREEFTVEDYRDLRSFDWAPDGKGFFTSAVTTTGSVLLHVDLHGTPYKLWDVEGSHLVWAVPSPDGHLVVISAIVLGGNIWTLEHF